MADESMIRETITNYWKAFSAADHEALLALYTDDATVEDPVGTPPHVGKAAIAAFYESAHSLADAIELRGLDITLVCGHQAAFAMEIRPTIAGATYTMPAIDVMTFADDGRITSMRAFFQQDQLRPVE